MTKEYKINQLSSWAYFYKLLIITFVFHLLGFFVVVYFKNVEGVKAINMILLAIIIAWLLFFALPVLILYVNHKRFSKSVIFKVDGEVYTYNSLHESFTFNLEDIKKVELWLTPPAYDKRIDFLYFGKYHFTSIYTKQGQVISISCLVCDEITEIFPEELIERKKKFFPLMK